MGVFDSFPCDDFNGGPPTNLGDEVHILVTDSNDPDLVYFDGMVRVGDFFTASNGELVGDTAVITVRTPDQATLLQVC